MIWLPPQHGKSELSTRRLPAWVLGNHPDMKIAITSYNSTIASKFNKDIQKIIESEEYMNLYPDTKLQGMEYGDRKLTSALRNSSEFEVVGKEGSLITVGVGGSLTSRQVDLLIMDDLYKDAMEAWSPIVRQNVQDWYDTTAETRLHNESKTICVFTRWDDDDLAGRLIKEESEDWEIIVYPAIATKDELHRKKGEALWEKRHSLEKLLKIKKKNEHTFGCLYQQDPKPKEGMLYQGLKEYLPEDLPQGYQSLQMTDVADKGADYLCSIFYWEANGYAYVRDVIYTQKDNNYTIPLLAKKTVEHKPVRGVYESNAAGNVFADQIRKAFIKLGHLYTAIVKFHQNQNKESRILNHATVVEDKILFPKGWNVMWPEFYQAMTRFKRLFKKNTHDDAPDCCTAIAEGLGKSVNAEIYEDQAADYEDDYDDELDDDDF